MFVLNLTEERKSNRFGTKRVRVNDDRIFISSWTVSSGSTGMSWKINNGGMIEIEYKVDWSSKLFYLSFINIQDCFPVIVSWSHQSAAALPIHLSWLNRETSWIGCLSLNVWPITSLIANTRWAHRHSGSGADHSSRVERGAVNQPWLGMWRLGRG